MSTLCLCSVFDVKVGSFAAPFVTKSKGEAIRSFEDAVGDPKMPFKAHPADYVLFCVGTFDDLTGLVSSFSVAERLVSASDFPQAI